MGNSSSGSAGPSKEALVPNGELSWDVPWSTPLICLHSNQNENFQMFDFYQRSSEGPDPMSGELFSLFLGKNSNTKSNISSNFIHESVIENLYLGALMSWPVKMNLQGPFHVYSRIKIVPDL